MSEKRDLNLAIARIEKSNEAMEMATECINALVAERDAMAAKIAALEAERDALRSGAAGDVLAERHRQIEAEGWTPDHDDSYAQGQLAEAAAAYASESAASHAGLPNGWPWAREWWKPSTPRRNLVKAGALILAEIDRIDRAAIAAKGAQS